MEILSISTDFEAKLVFCIIISIFSVMLFIYGNFGEGVNWITRFLSLIGSLLLICAWLLPTNTYYDVIVTDWNEVYEQGYEIVEQNGKIVTLRKVDD